MKLVIVESQTKTRKIAAILSKLYGAGQFKVMASLGHIRDLPMRDFGIDIDNGFAPTYTNLPKKSKVIKRLRDALKQADGLYLASDLDREGEAIAWHLQQVLKPKCPVWRVSFNAITEVAIREAFAHPLDIDMKLVAAQETRRIVDRLVGYKVSPVLWSELEGLNLSAGRVQSATLALIVRREREINNFIPEEYWQIDAQLQQGEERFSARLIGWQAQAWTRYTFPTKQALDLALGQLNSQAYLVKDVRAETITRKPHPPFMTSSLQQAASTHLKLGTERTMALAQKLYEHGLITYMRTDSPYIAPEAQALASQYIQAQYGDTYLPDKVRHYTAKGAAQEAHEAIRPTDIALTNVSAELDDPLYQKLYGLIWKRFLASQMADAQYLRRRVMIQAGQIARFQAEAKQLDFEAFLVLYDYKSDTDSDDPDVDEAQTLPYLSKGDVCKLQSLTPQQKFTKAPATFTEASIVQYLEQAGIGRPSTYASTIATLKNRKYVKLNKRKFIATSLGLEVATFLEREFTLIFDPQFTAAMETALDKVANGDLNARTFLDAVWQKLEPLLAKWNLETGAGRSDLVDEADAIICPVCHLGHLRQRKSRKGEAFYSCSQYPSCKYSRNLADKPQFTGEQCPNCAADLLIKARRDGGKFVACSNFPTCRYSQSIHK